MTGAPRDRLRSKKKPQRKTVRFCNDPDLQDRWETLQLALSGARETASMYNDDGSKRALEDLRAQEAELRPLIEEATETFVFQSLSRKRYDALVDAHPPTQDQVDENRKEGLPKPQINFETFPPALIQACCIDPETGEPRLSEDDVKWLWNDDESPYSSGELQLLYDTAFLVNSQRRVVDLGKG